MDRFRIGPVAFLNALPLIYGLEQRADVKLIGHVPSRLAEELNAGNLDAGLVPSIDFYRHETQWHMLPGGMIGSDGEVLTVRVFSRIPPGEIQKLTGDTDSHTSVALSRILWAERHGTVLEIEPLAQQPEAYQSVLLIGDKVMRESGRWPYEVDMGLAWREMTGLPFVYAVWATPASMSLERENSLARLLRETRENGMRHLEEIARNRAADHGFTPEQALRYFQRNIRYKLSEQAHAGLLEFFRLAGKHNC